MNLEKLLLSASISFAIALAAGPVLIPVLRKLKLGQTVRSDGPARHLQKMGTPTMGGLIFLAGITTAGLITSRGLTDGLLVLIVGLCFGVIGFVDDFIKVALHRPLGLRAREKLLGQVVVAALLSLTALFYLGRGTSLVIPFSGFLSGGPLFIELDGWLFLLFSVVVIVGTANAVNLTDGLDGLAAGVTFFASLAFMFIALQVGKAGVAAVLAATAGGLAAFLIFNRYPARVFMGDTGSLALGGILGAAAVLTRSELFLLVTGGVFVLETLSVIIQVLFFQILGRRLFRMSPLHHHFELLNWPEKKVVGLFWSLALGFAMLGLLGTVGIMW